MDRINGLNIEVFFPNKGGKMAAIKFDSPKLISQGARLNDELMIRPLRGNRKKVLLNRTKWILKSTNLNSVQKSGFEVFLPSFKDEKFQFEMDLVDLVDPLKNHKYQRYLLKSLNSIPFQINGSYSLNSFLERGDSVRIGYNQLIFQDNHQNNKLDLRGISPGPINEGLLISDLSVLLTGETGTGKSYFAKMIHERMNRLGKFVPLNLSAFPPTLIESELFGHSRGSFTGAIKAKSGAFLEANKGTLFLDEIDSLPLDIQTKLLLFLDNQEVRPVGSSRSEKVDIKIILASGRDLCELVKRGKMRKDFYFRIASELKINMSPLRKRRSDILYFCKQFQENQGVLISRKLSDFYYYYNWPGNIRQLMGHLRKKKIYTKGLKFDYDEIDDHLIDDSGLYETDMGQTDMMTMEELKYLYAYQTSQKFRGSIKRSSKALNISENTFREYIRKFELKRELRSNQQEWI